MKTQRPFNLSVAVLLMLSVVTAAAWIQSEFTQWFVYRAERTSQFTIAWGAGELAFLSIQVSIGLGPPRIQWRVNHFRVGKSIGHQFLRATRTPEQWWDQIGFHRIRGKTSPSWAGDLSLVAVPFWFVQLAAGCVPLWWIARRHRSTRRSSRGCCTACGYDLRATPARCSECGAGAASV